MDKRTKIVVIGIACIGFLGFLGWKFVEGMNSWADYDPKEAAVNRVEEAIDVAYKNPETDAFHDLIPSCGGLWFPNDCWKILQDVSISNNNQYTMTVTSFNGNDQIPPTRGGDEILIDVLFEDGSVVFVSTYESCIEWCEVSD